MEKYIYKAKLVRVVDGDTVDAMIDLGFDTWVKKRIRFHGVDTWECRTKNLEEKKKGLAAKARTKELLSDCLLYTSPSPRDPKTSRMPSSA